MKKRILLLLFCVSVTISAKAQLGTTIVNDPINYAQLVEVVTQAQEQINKAEEQINFAKKIEGRVQEVNKTIKKVQFASDVVSAGTKTINQIDKLYRTIREAQVSIAYANMVTVRCNQAIRQVTSCMEYVSVIMGDGFNMSDHERLTLMKENLSAMQSATRSMQILEDRTRRLGVQTRLFKRF